VCTIGFRDERAGVLKLYDKLRNIVSCKDYFLTEYKPLFLAGIRMISMTAETALEEESAMVCKVERYKAPRFSPMKYTICNKSEHNCNNCFSKVKRDSRVNKCSVGRSEPRLLSNLL
jgi:hypothetical protein